MNRLIGTSNAVWTYEQHHGPPPPNDEQTDWGYEQYQDPPPINPIFSKWELAEAPGTYDDEGAEHQASPLYVIILFTHT